MIFKDLFIKEKSYIIEVKIDDKYYLWIECLDEYGGSITGDFDEEKLTNNYLVELHTY